MPGPLNYTTTVDSMKTAGECTMMLAMHGALAVTMMYQKGRPTGLSFTMRTPHGDRGYALPVNVKGMQAALQRAYQARRVPRSATELEQAERVAWRVLKDWLAAQLALVEAQLVDMPQVMLPYMLVSEAGDTVWDRFLAQGALEAGS